MCLPIGIGSNVYSTKWKEMSIQNVEHKHNSTIKFRPPLVVRWGEIISVWLCVGGDVVILWYCYSNINLHSGTISESWWPFFLIEWKSQTVRNDKRGFRCWSRWEWIERSVRMTFCLRHANYTPYSQIAIIHSR